MLNFDFYNPTQILFGKGRIADLDKAVPANAKVLVLYGGGSIKQNGVFDQVMAALGSRSVTEFTGIEPNPTYETLMGAVEVIKKEKKPADQMPKDGLVVLELEEQLFRSLLQTLVLCLLQ